MTEPSHNPDNPSAPNPAGGGPVTQDNEPQIDPELAMAEGRAGPGRITITAVAAVFILVVFFYGLNHQRPEMVETPTATASDTTGAATPQPAPNDQADAKAPAAGQKAPAANPQDANTGNSGSGQKQ